MRTQLYTIANNLISGMPGAPPYIILFVSDKCPNNCSHCWYNKDWKEKHLKGKNLSFNEIKKISESISFVHFLTITGGEAFFRDDIEEIVSVFNRNTKLSRCDIPTSGFDNELICRKTEKILSENRSLPFRVDVSLDGLEETHNKIRCNNNAFQNAIKTIERLKKLRDRYDNFDISIISTISKDNCMEVGILSDFVQKILPDAEWMVNIARSNEDRTSVSAEELSAYKKAASILSHRIKNNNFTGDRAHRIGKLLTAKNSLRRELIIEVLEQRRKGGGCAAGSLAGVIFNDGEIRPCEVLNSSFGNIRDYNYDLPKIWNSRKAKKIRKEIQKTECLCTHECFLSLSILIQPSSLFRLVKKLLE